MRAGRGAAAWTRDELHERQGGFPDPSGRDQSLMRAQSIVLCPSRP